MSIETTFCFLLHDAARLWGKRFDHFARDAALSRAQAKAIGYILRNEGIHQGALADLLEIEPISLARLIDRLQAGGLVERRVDPADRRARRLYVTDKAREAFARVREVVAAIEAQALAGFSPEEVRTLMGLMARVHGNLSERAGPSAQAECSLNHPPRELD